MRVALDGYPLAEPRAGIGHYTFELARALALAAPADQFDLVSPAPFEPTLLADLKHSGLPNLRAVHANSSTVRGHWWSVGLPLYARRERFDLFHGTNYDLPFWNGRRGVLTIHDLSTLLHPEKHRKRLVRRTRLRLPLTIKLASVIITPTESVRREVIEHLKVNPDKVVAVHSAPRETFQPQTWEQTAGIRRQLKVEDEFLLFVGTLEPRKNLLTLLEAFELVMSEKRFRTQLVIAGGAGWLMDELHSFSGRAALREKVLFTGYLSDDQLRGLYASCRAFIYPSVYEGFGFPPLEAMACDAPVIAGRNPALQETLGDAALLVEPMDVTAWASTITRLLSDEELRKTLSMAGAQQVRQYSWKKTARLTLEVYKRALDERRQSSAVS